MTLYWYHGKDDNFEANRIVRGFECDEKRRGTTATDSFPHMLNRMVTPTSTKPVNLQWFAYHLQRALSPNYMRFEVILPLVYTYKKREEDCGYDSTETVEGEIRVVWLFGHTMSCIHCFVIHRYHNYCRWIPDWKLYGTWTKHSQIVYLAVLENKDVSFEKI